MPDIVHLLTVDAPLERVYAAVTNEEDIRQWWTADADVERSVGGNGVVRFYEGKGVTTFKIEALEPPKRVVWAITTSNAPGGWEGTSVTFDLAACESGTTLRFAHRGFEAESDGYALVNTGWAYYLVSLKRHIESSRGLPQQKKDFVEVFTR